MKKLLIALACVTLLAVPLSHADNHESPPNLADTWYVVVKPGHYDEFEAAFKAHLDKRAAAGDSREWDTFSPVLGGHMSHYVIRSCCFHWADQDSYTAWSMENSALSDDWDANVDPHVEEYKHYLYALDFDNSHWAEDAPEYNYFGVTRWTPKQGSGGSMSAAVEEISSLAKKANWPRYWSWSNRIGGKPNLTLVSPFENYADMAPPEPSFFERMSQELGGDEAAQEMFQRFSSNFEGSTYTVYVHRPDLSMGEDD